MRSGAVPRLSIVLENDSAVFLIENYDSLALHQAQIMNKPLLFLIVIGMALGARATEVSAQDSLSRPVFLLGGATCGRALSISPAKMEAGCALALHLSGRYALFPTEKVDSVAKEIIAAEAAAVGATSGAVAGAASGAATGAASGATAGSVDSMSPISSKRVATTIGARGILFVRFDRLENIIRAEVRIVWDSGYTRTTTGRGFALIRYRSEKMNEVVSDPAMLTALQRALCVAMGDSALYSSGEGIYRVKPAPTLVPGGMVFTSNGSYSPWIVFDKHTVAAYDAVVNVFDTLKNSQDVVCFDIDTRDSVYALFRLFLIENDALPSTNELDALQRLEVSYYITGSCTRTERGAEISLSLARINTGGTYTVLRTVQSELMDDTIVQFRRVVRSLAAQLVHEHFTAK